MPSSNIKSIQNDAGSSGSDRSEIERIEGQLRDLSSDHCRGLWKKIRKRKDMTQIQAANALEIENTRLNGFETARNDRMRSDGMDPLIHLLATWCHELGIDPIGYLFGHTKSDTTKAEVDSLLVSGPSSGESTSHLEAEGNLRSNILASCRNVNERRRMESQLENRSVDELAGLFLAMNNPPKRGR